MTIEELKERLTEKGFQASEQDSGIKYDNFQGQVELICYIEPEIRVQFISYFRWDNNEVKGTYDLTLNQLKAETATLAHLFKRTLANMPECIGDKADAHIEVAEAMYEVFGEI